MPMPMVGRSCVTKYDCASAAERAPVVVVTWMRRTCYNTRKAPVLSLFHCEQHGVVARHPLRGTPHMRHRLCVCVFMCVCYGPTGRGTRTGHAS
eukprot:1790926-Prymnesium_polylepis.1